MAERLRRISPVPVGDETKPRRRRIRTDRIPVGRDGGMAVWIEVARPGLHFRVDDNPSPFEITGSWRIHEQRLVLIEVAVRSRFPSRGLSSLVDLLYPREDSDPPPPITGTALRSVSVPELERRTRAALKRSSTDEEELERGRKLAREQGLDIPALYAVPRTARDIMSKLGDEPFRPGRQGYPIRLYEWIAVEYLRLSRSGSRRILPELAERASGRLERDVSIANVRDWVHRARELKFLTKGMQGKAHADPGPALRRDLL